MIGSRSSSTPSGPLVDIAVCGKFHYFNYARFLDERGALAQFIFSHRVGAGRRLGLSAPAVNLFFKEYLLHLHMRMAAGGQSGEGFDLFLQDAWDRLASRRLRPAKLLHFLMHGNCRALIRRARGFGMLCVGEAVNSHPRDYYAQIALEHEDLGLPGRAGFPGFARRIEEEIPLVDKILVPSAFVAQSYLRHGVAPARIHEIPFGANLDEFTPAPAPPDKFRVICVAQVALRKGHQYLLRAWKKLGLPNAELHCYGFIDRTVHAKLIEIGARDVFFHGSVPKPELIAALRQSSLFVLPTVEEGFAFAISEALACGLPVVTTSHSGAEGVLEHGESGFILPPRNVEELAAVIENLYRNPDLRASVGASGRKLVEHHLNWRVYADRLCDFYTQCLLP